MAYRFVNYEEEHVALVKDFNSRISASGMRFREESVPAWLPEEPGVPLWQEYYVCLSESGDRAHGGFIWKYQPFQVLEDESVVVDLQLPISEGIVDKQHASLGAEILTHTLANHSFTYALGMGGRQQPVARLFKAARFRFADCPMFFKVLRPFRFLTRMAYLRRKPWMRFLAISAAYSGAGSLIVPALHAFLKLRHGVCRSASIKSRLISEFDSSVYDSFYNACRKNYALLAARTADILNKLYPSQDVRFHRIELRDGHRLVGFAVVMANDLDDRKYFGKLRLGSVVDCLALPGYEREVITHAERYLRTLKADLIISNQLHRDWCAAFRDNGYLTFPSNYVLAVSPKLAQKLAPFEDNVARIHMTRGDGDGPIHI